MTPYDQHTMHTLRSIAWRLAELQRALLNAVDQSRYQRQLLATQLLQVTQTVQAMQAHQRFEASFASVVSSRRPAPRLDVFIHFPALGDSAALDDDDPDTDYVEDDETE